jgi:uncharacterized phage-associated protein
MAVSVLQVARTIGDLSGWNLSNLEMQKIAFIAEMLHLGRTGAPLTEGDFQAWDRGPVHPDLYHWAKMYGSSKLPPTAFRHVAPLSPVTPAYKAVKDAYESMKGMSPWRMVDLTHQADGAWASCYVPGRRGTIIPKHKIAREYGVRVTETN